MATSTMLLSALLGPLVDGFIPGSETAKNKASKALERSTRYVQEMFIVALYSPHNNSIIMAL
jgi:hypothetical protein